MQQERGIIDVSFFPFTALRVFQPGLAYENKPPCMLQICCAIFF